MLETSYPSQVFRGVHFVLFGFNPITESKIRFKLVNGGGVEAGKEYNRNCTHVIVDRVAHDDPVCVAARKDGKTLVTALWVEHSADIGMPVDSTSVMYRPLKDLNGIPGAKNLVMCLTGYMRQDRDDIMTMVGRMGAQFSKPLVASKVTHLLCYKFEGEKYELAKRMGTIKLVNHRWLEDCLKDWTLLPEDKYNKSGYELEMMGEEAKDSEEEAEDPKLGQSGGRNINKTPLSSKFGIAMTNGLSKSVGEASNASPGSAGPQVLPKVKKGQDSFIIPGSKNKYDQDLSFDYVDDQKIRHATSCQLPDKYLKTSESKNADFPKALDCQDLGITGNTVSSGLLPGLQAGTSESKKLVSDLRSNTASAEGLTHSDAKLGTTNYSKNQTRLTLPRNLDECLGNATGSAVSPLDDLKVGNNLETSSNKVEKANEGIKSTCGEGSGNGNDFLKEDGPPNLLPQKRINEASSTKLKSRKMATDAKSSRERTPLANGKSQGLKMTSLVDEPPGAEGYLSVGKDGMNNSISKSAASNSNSRAFDEHFSKNATSDAAQHDNACQYSAQAAVQSLSESKICDKPDITGFEIGQVDGNDAEQHNIVKNLEYSSPGNKKSQNEESAGHTNLDISNEESAKLVRKSPRKKSVAKRSLGCRPKVGAFAKQKRSVSLNKTTPQCKGVNSFSGSKEIATSEKLQASPQILDVNKSKEQETISKYAEDAGGTTTFLDDETEAPDDKIEDEFGMAHYEKKSESVHVSKTADITEEQSEPIHPMTKNEEAMPPKKGTNGTEKQKPPPLVDSTSKLKVKHQAMKRPAGSRTKKTVAKDLSKSEEAVSAKKIHNERKHETEMEVLEEIPPSADVSETSTAPRNKPENFIEENKENRPIDGEQDDAVEGKSVGNQIIKSSARPAKVNPKKMGLNPSKSEANTRVKAEAVCFIVSGHRLQRKEFQQAIKRLKGRVCRDSHQWSYQATHFIAPDPVKRTEKFFAAAASGRWILKTDFLTASIEAGKFLPEEPYEWHKSGLSEDGAINMEAPRKWRLLKERTGHGAFYGMHIVVYGDCIAPPLDTLKRVVKAGDGTILATSPPYTRFLGTGIDYAIVSPGMPRVDLWVQEFLKHEIPCVVADYLVEYVCKPGFSLERHVLYGTHSWAERSYDKLQSRAEEIIEELIPPKDCDDDVDDTICQVCGSRDRGDVMLICGDESGSVGCGVGTHIDCCDPPLTEVPEEDWFCPKCSSTPNCSNSSRKRKKCASASSKRK